MKAGIAKRLSMYLVVALTPIAFSCSRNPMDTPLQASSLQEYVRNVTQLAKRMSAGERERFLDAIAVMAFDFEAAVTTTLVGGPPGTVEALTESAMGLNGMTPREIIEKGEANLARVKEALRERGRDTEWATIEEIKAMAAKEQIRMVEEPAGGPAEESLSEPAAAPAETKPGRDDPHRVRPAEQPRARANAAKRAREAAESGD
ncbi:MAG: hypothetical protein JW958_09170 [Candidatus Eisenbacteria bacterium]|nr:hypothetical protein [Candidatus Eisenbacteria bacterium]